jgi:hypothetical protein
MELIWKKNTSGGYTAVGNAGKYVLALINGLWTVKQGTSVLGKVKGLVNAQAKAQANEPADTDEDFDPAIKAGIAVKSTARTAKIPAASIAKGTQTIAKPTVKAKTPKEFMTIDQWLEDNPTPAKTRKQTAEEYAKVVKGHRMGYARAKGAYNKANGITATASASASTPKSTATARQPKVVAEPVSKEERYGREVWHNFGEGDKLQYALSQINNAIGSLAYSIEHAKSHPYTPIGQNSYYKSVERLYQAEERFSKQVEDSVIEEPKDFEYQIFGKSLSELDNDVYDLAGYVDYYSEPEHWMHADKAKIVNPKTSKLTGINEELLTLYPVVSAPKKAVRRAPIRK